MRNSRYFILMCLLALGCSQNRGESISSVNPKTQLNMTEATVSEFSWMNQPKSYEIEDSTLRVTVNAGTDFFNNPEDSSIVNSAPFLHRNAEGDFVAKTLVEPDFSSQWNAVALMVHLDAMNWIKFAFENSDATGPGIVSVVTKGSSDDANGVVLNSEKKIWLAIARKGNVYSMHWSGDGKNYTMARLSAMPEQDIVKIGVEAQSPVGDSATHLIHFFEIEENSVDDLRNIN